ncbi:pimeloyl-ACP methyl ester carboxylesterase [Streptosporangium becharense]|uniref:Pimeloyl-ACP methyl ester carboxylesterase n=1 Tax=Streptosporangium becharense TaxID=1816182 RepID=A0A7W9IEY1_9ACTN|nr:alpha/beta fold hydrolase [Streptosporangium becharense]MBB2912326.1 pimeloyl-ACP methyl ester carboxylesterase [Streptosporangium becharense]MBB5818873.1 pimeloyl-ACP methyl ester carboxylesterase [Streptosporangium becharense]
MTVLLPGVALTDHTFTVPLDHADPGGETIEIFAREAIDPARRGENLPWLLFLQGGPGGKSPRPTAADGWLGHALKTHRVLLLDQRGAGRSTPLTARTVTGTDEEIAARLMHYRADSIVADAELIRRELCGDRPWETLGQSYGGFVTLTYLSRAPEGLKACYITGGLPGLEATADDVYARTYPRVRAKVDRYFARYPEDAGRLRAVTDHLRHHEVMLPDGDVLTVRRLQTLGLCLGMSDGAEYLHWLLDEAWHGDRLSDLFRYEVMMATGFVGNPLYAVMHEAIYAQGAATAWAAHRLLPGEFHEDAEPALPVGEMIYPWMFDDIAALRPFKGAAEILAAESGWPALYDPARLAANRVPVAAAVYYDDMYVEEDLSMRTAAAIGNVRTWVTNEWEHDGLRVSGGRVLARLMDIVNGVHGS